MVCHLAAVDASACAERIAGAIDEVGDLRHVGGPVRRSLVEALQRIAFCPESFDEGARLLVRLAVAENEPRIANNATGQFAALFPMVYGETAAGGGPRLALLKELADTQDPRQRKVSSEALLSGIKTSHFSRFIGAETHGSRPAMQPWHPDNRQEAIMYVATCVRLLAELAIADDDNGTSARTGLAHSLRELVGFGLIDIVEEVVTRIVEAVGGWTIAIEGLGDFLQFDAADASDDVRTRVAALMNKLQPDDLFARAGYLVTDMPWDYPCGEELDFHVQIERQLAAVQAVADEILKHPEVLAGVLPRLTRGRQRWAPAFGERLAMGVDSPRRWLELITAAITDAPEAERDFELLAGFIVGMANENPGSVAAFKHRLATSPVLVPALPLVCWRLGVVRPDIDIAVKAVRAGLLPPWRLSQWGSGGALSELSSSDVAPLFDTLLEHSPDSFSVALDLMGMFAHSVPERLDRLRPQILKAAQNAMAIRAWQADPMAPHHFETIMKWMLTKGRQDQDARAVALVLARALARGNVGDHGKDPFRSVLPLLLSEFPEIVWPLVGQAIVKSEEGTWRLRHLLEGPPSFGDDHKEPYFLSLPSETLFAWCEAHPDVAPAFAAAVVPFLAPPKDGACAGNLHPLYRGLLDEFGHCDGVLDAAWVNIHSFGWWGSLTTYFAKYKAPVESLLAHPRPQVARWARRMLRALDDEIARAQRNEEEDDAQQEV